MGAINMVFRIRKLNKLTASDLILIGYFLFVFVFIFGQTQYGELFRYPILKPIINFIVIILALVGTALKQSLNWRTLLAVSILLVIGVIVGIRSDKITNLVFIVLFVYTGSLIDSDKALKTYTIAASIVVTFIILLSYVKKPEMISITRGARGRRFYLGFSWVSFAPNYFFHIVLAYYAQKKNEIKFKNVVIVLAINQALFFLTNTKAVYFGILLLIILLLLDRMIPATTNNQLFRGVTIAAFPLTAFFSCLLAFYYNPSNAFMRALDNALTGRLSLGKKTLDLAGVPLLGSSIDWETSAISHNADSAYLNILISYGIIVLVLAVIGFTLLCVKTVSKRNRRLGICLLMLALHSFSDPQLLSLRYDPFILLLGTLLVKKRMDVRAAQINREDYALNKN